MMGNSRRVSTMKITQKNKVKKPNSKKKSVIKHKKEHVHIVAHEIKFARLLSGNEKKTRDRALKMLKRWLINCFDKQYEFKEDDFKRIWKGLFYAVWMSDKPLVQEELCENISGILDLFPPEQLRHALLMVKVGLQAMASEWYGIDHHRMDKCLMDTSPLTLHVEIVKKFLQADITVPSGSRMIVLVKLTTSWLRPTALVNPTPKGRDGIYQNIPISNVNQHKIVYTIDSQNRQVLLVRRYLRGSLRCIARCGWSEEACKMYADMLSENDGILALKTPMYARNALSMILHVIDCYLEEISKVSEGTIPPLRLLDMITPFCRYLCFGSEQTLYVASRRMLTELVRQSDQGLEYQEKTRAWERMGCPEGGPDALQEVSDDDDDDDEETDEQLEDADKPLDPRAGRVSVALAPLPVPAEAVAALLSSMRPKVAGRARQRVNLTIMRFNKLAQEQYPLKLATVELDEGPKVPPPEQVAKGLQTLEKQLMATSDELALRGLSRKHRKRLLAKTRAGVSIVEDPLLKTRNNAAGDWQVEDTKPDENKKKKNKQDTSNKENFDKKLKKRKPEPEKNVTNKKRKMDVKNENTVPKHKKKEQKKNEPRIIVAPKSPKLKPAQNTEPKEKQKNPKTAPAKTLVPEPKTPVKRSKTATTVVSKKVKNFQKQLSPKESSSIHSTPKKVKFVLKNNSMQETVDYYKSVRQSPKIPFDSSKAPSKTNLKPSTPSPINPFFKKKWKLH